MPQEKAVPVQVTAIIWKEPQAKDFTLIFDLTVSLGTALNCSSSRISVNFFYY